MKRSYERTGPELDAEFKPELKVEPELKVTTEIKPEVKSGIKPELKSDPEEYLLSVDGFLSKVKEVLEQLPEGHVPYKIVFEATGMKSFGKQSFLIFVKKCSDCKKKITLIDEIGISKFREKINPMLKFYTILEILTLPIDKTGGRKEYVAILLEK
jgi:hypothetical protein